MEDKIRVSVAMATYNGERYIKEQIDSIINQFNENDELIISDDGSTDKTIEIIKKYNDKRIKLVKGPKQGFKKNFENALNNCSGKYVFFSDQDDIWSQDKIEKVLLTFSKNKCNCIVHDSFVVNSDNTEILMDSFFKYRKSKKGIIHNLVKCGYYGFCMAFERKMLKKILPFPSLIESHDQWTGLICEKYGKTKFINDKLECYRRHENNVSSLNHSSIYKMLKKRIILVFYLITR